MLLAPYRYAALLLAAVLLWPTAAGAVRPDGVLWTSNVRQAWAVARAQQRPLLLYARMNGCHYCRKLERETLSNAQVMSDIQQLFVTASAEVHQQRDLVRQLAVRSFPTLVVIGPDGRVLDAINGYLPPDKLRWRLRAAVTRR